MKIRKPISFVLGIIFFIFGIFMLIKGGFGGIVPLLIGASLIYLGWQGTRIATIIFGHILVVIGCALITLGIYLLPYSKPTLMHIFFRPLFWGLFSVFGGICAIYHGFCNCIRCPKNS
jgi:hypothetical protein